MANPLVNLAAIGHDLRKFSLSKLPTSLERVALIFINMKTHKGQQSPKAALKMGKLAHYMELKIYYIIDPTTDEFIDIMQHFVTRVSEYLFIFSVATVIDQKFNNQPAQIQMKDGYADSQLIGDLFNSKDPESRICFLMDGVNNPNEWTPSKLGLKRSGVLIMAPYPDPAKKSVQQFDSTAESLFALEVDKIYKEGPEMTGANLAKAVSEELKPFGMKVFVESYPPEFATELSFSI
ncbi:hypothetical protein GPJ56_003074 [Histomonas meleagridis]|uniref:uncharacterized protein n=1 Tax=Histomonas meleagridis TaxID=135588 RepID=UPI0035598810|nr:hypothetical protein GPJ56_003074 [Histomonas meleagridis]KAH0805152.1 hypothetical protein GO595_002097 [Histomonas meleagridis]